MDSCSQDYSTEKIMSQCLLSLKGSTVSQSVAMVYKSEVTQFILTSVIGTGFTCCSW